MQVAAAMAAASTVKRGRLRRGMRSGSSSARTAANTVGLSGARAAVVFASVICTGTLTGAATEAGAVSVQAIQVALVWHCVWTAPVKPKFGVIRRFADSVETGPAEMVLGVSVNVTGGVMVSVCGGVAGAEAKNPLGVYVAVMT